MSAKFVRPADREWMRLAACDSPDIDPEWFFPSSENGPSLSKARGVCASCFVQRDCLAYALAVEGGQPAKSREGVYAGTTGGERYRLHQKAQAQGRRQQVTQQADPAPKPKRKSPEPAVCGTNAGYRKHIRDKTEICGPCRQAHADADNRLRRTGTTRAVA
jgi:hypothetical protein